MKQTCPQSHNWEMAEEILNSKAQPVSPRPRGGPCWKQTTPWPTPPLTDLSYGPRAGALEAAMTQEEMPLTGGPAFPSAPQSLSCVLGTSFSSRAPCLTQSLCCDSRHSKLIQLVVLGLGGSWSTPILGTGDIEQSLWVGPAEARGF